MSLSHFFSKTKDRVVSTAAKKLIQPRITPFGTMSSFAIDSVTKTITLELLLKGETTPVSVTLANYELTTDSRGRPWLQVQEATASREWIETILKEYLVGKPFALPPKAAPLLKMLV